MPEITEEQLEQFKKDAEKARNLEASKTRLEDENSKIKKRAQDAESKLTAAEEKKLEEEGNLNELLSMANKKNSELEDKLTKRTKSVLAEKVRAEVAKHAKDAHDVDMLLRVKEHKDLLKINDEELTVEGVENFVGKVRETHSFLFGSKRMPDYDNTKGGKGNEDEDVDKDDDKRYQDELSKVTTRKEQIEVMKKYGKEVDSYTSGM